ncbi:hypothetical protein F7725_028167 [Dissostichus mawsoni]|uniref:Cadherin domain-containing protein n=1 Tax=Dissostichus mawsoni TaxID=36200 RepID=A0A7J5XG56_DISMA|nr:hypothetical protein F7725_028167 [Dissostichus mawsoni]
MVLPSSMRIRSDYDKNKILHYTLQGPGANEEPLNRFTVDQHTGLVYIQGTLDREEKETYILTGLALFSNGSVAEGKIDLSFEVEDENDNPPVFVDVPPATVIESSPAGTLVGVVKATDADKANYYHSKIAYSIEKQEPSDGRDLFYIDRENGTIYVKENTTDREYACSIVENTADVEVMRFKTLDADEERTDNWLAVFDIVTGNEDGIFSIKTDPHTNEGILLLNPKENPLKEVIAVYTATDVDTEKPAKNVRYAKGYDPENWLLIDSETAEIRLQKVPDRESPYLCFLIPTDNPPKMSTGTIALQVGDVNDNCPTLTKQKEHICSDTEILTVTAVDPDGDPNSAPFNFLVVSGKSQGEWRVEPLNGTSTSLRTLKALWPGHYQVVFIIEDQQGLVCPDPQYLDLHVCL